MIALGLVLNTVGLGLFCWLIFALAVYTVPFFVAISIGMLTFHSGAGVVGALLVGMIAGASTLVVGQTTFAMTRSTILRAAIGAAFAVPAAIAGYHVVFAMSQIGVPSLAWREVFACLGAVSVGATAWIRLTAFAETRPLLSSGAVAEWASDDFDGRHAQRIALSHRCREQVRVDRRVERGIVELAREGDISLASIKLTAPTSAQPTRIRWGGHSLAAIVG